VFAGATQTDSSFGLGTDLTVGENGAPEHRLRTWAARQIRHLCLPGALVPHYRWRLLLRGLNRCRCSANSPSRCSGSKSHGPPRRDVAAVNPDRSSQHHGEVSTVNPAPCLFPSNASAVVPLVPDPPIPGKSPPAPLARNTGLSDTYSGRQTTIGRDWVRIRREVTSVPLGEGRLAELSASRSFGHCWPPWGWFA
jgi:hypothetical protein